MGRISKSAGWLLLVVIFLALAGVAVYVHEKLVQGQGGGKIHIELPQDATALDDRGGYLCAAQCGEATILAGRYHLPADQDRIAYSEVRKKGDRLLFDIGNVRPQTENPAWYDLGNLDIVKTYNSRKGLYIKTLVQYNSGGFAAWPFMLRTMIFRSTTPCSRRSTVPATSFHVRPRFWTKQGRRIYTSSSGWGCCSPS